MATPRDSIGHRSETVRRANLSAIVRELHVHGPLSRSDLVTRTGLTRSGIRALIGELVSAGLVDERPSLPAGMPGRPSPMVRPMADRAIVLALEVNIDSLAMAVVGYGGAVQRIQRVDRPRTHVTVEEIVDDLVDLVRPILGTLRHGGALLGIGVAVAGTVRRTDGVVRQAPNLGWREVPLGERLRTALDLDVPLWVANEADLGGLAEHRRGAAVGVDDVVYVMGEVGVGGNLIVHGKPLVGAAGYGGEVGHMPLNPSGSACGCGSSGCWETEVGERAMLVRAGRPADGGREAVSELIEAARTGDAQARDALAHVASWLGIGLAALVNVFNPRLVVLGGTFERIHPIMGPSIEEAMRRRALPPSAELVRVVPGTLGADAPLLGAAELAFETLLADPAARLGPRTQVLATA
ncbi:MAG TPA: ROK family transcriptional regulator [Patescibacteria group bacterium]|nr:ROK family transcriptional regulator [Patescibacteria group bacterium]